MRGQPARGPLLLCEGDQKQQEGGEGRRRPARTVKGASSAADLTRSSRSYSLRQRMGRIDAGSLKASSFADLHLAASKQGKP